MTILHIAHVGEDRLCGVNVAVPAIVHAQGEIARAGLLNLCGAAVPEISNCFFYKKGMHLSDLPEPFCKPDIVVFHELYRPAFLSLSAQVRAMGIPYVILPHGCMTVSAQRIKAYKKIPANLLLFGRMIRGAAAVQCLSEREQAQLKFAVPSFIGTNGIALGPVKRELSGEEMKFTYIGRMDWHIKGLDLLMGALGREREFLLQNRCRFTLCGPDVGGTVEKLHNRSLELGLGGLVSFRDAVTGEEKQRILLNTDCYIQTSRSEGMSMGILEALGMGIPCLVTEGTGMAHLVRDREAGWGCATAEDAIAEAIRTAVQQKNSLRVYSANARALAEDQFTWNETAADAIRHYQTIISGKNF